MKLFYGWNPSVIRSLPPAPRRNFPKQWRNPIPRARSSFLPIQVLRALRLTLSQLRWFSYGHSALRWMPRRGLLNCQRPKVDRREFEQSSNNGLRRMPQVPFRG